MSIFRELGRVSFEIFDEVLGFEGLKFFSFCFACGALLAGEGALALAFAETVKRTMGQF